MHIEPYAYIKAHINPSNRIIYKYSHCIEYTPQIDELSNHCALFLSRFREFYYIQMEKYARQAVSEGVKNAEDLRVGGDSEIYRVLNLHYNRNNHIEVWGPQVRNTNTHTLHFILFSDRYCFANREKDEHVYLRQYRVTPDRRSIDSKLSFRC